MGSSCDCCGCQRRDNYRSHRVVAKQRDAFVYETSFASRTSTSRDFSELYDRTGPAELVWQYSRDGDTLGPYSIECGRSWQAVTETGGSLTQVGSYWPDDGAAKGGESTLVGVYGSEFKVLATFASRVHGTGAAELSLQAAGFTVSLAREFYDILPGAASTYKFPLWPTFPELGVVNETGSFTGLVGRQSERAALTFGDTTVWACQTGDRTQTFLGGVSFGFVIGYESGFSPLGESGGYVTAFGPLRVPAFTTSLPNRNTLLQQFAINRGNSGEDNAERWPVGDVFTPTPYPRSQVGYYPGPVAFKGRRVKVYRDDELIDTLLNPTEAQALAVTSENGEYLLVSENVEEADPEYEGEGLDDRRRVVRPLKEFRSFAIDDSTPVIGCSAPHDAYVGFPPSQQAGDVNGTGTNNLFRWVNATKPVVLRDDEPETIDNYVHSDDLSDMVPNAYINRASYVLTSDGLTDVYTRPAGTYEVQSSDLVDTPYCLFGNYAESVPTFDVTIHAVPAALTVPYPRLEDPGFYTAGYFRARLASEKVTTVKLRFFGGRVRASTVTSSQLTLTRDGEEVEGCTLSQLDAETWLVAVPEAAQTAGSFFVLTYDPDGDVVAIDNAGNEIEDAPVVLATRCAWLMASENGWPKKSDTQVTKNLDLGPIATIGQANETYDEQTGEMVLDSTGNALITDWGTVRSSTEVDEFDPNLPEDSPATALCSWFGLDTTIDPCPPKALRCPAPRSEQRHSSLFRSSEDIHSFRVSMVTKAPMDYRPPIWLTHTVGRTLYGKRLPQNLWGCLIATQAIPLDPAPVNYFGSPLLYSYAVEAGVFWLAAGRQVLEYGGRKTAVLGELMLEVRQSLLVRETYLGTNRYFLQTDADVITLSKDKEDLLVSGEAIEYPSVFDSSMVAPFKLAYWWRIEKV